MRFGGHETFAIREGWLHKGLKALVEHPEWFLDDDLADWLGVGRNMAKSIRYWLLATGLADIASGRQRDRKLKLAPTELGRIVWQGDPYFAETGTWWALHVNLVHSPDHAATWTWFFNSFHLDRFDRAVCLENLFRHLQMSKQRMPNRRTLDRDVACLLSTYARPIPGGTDDPEEGNDCPLRELGILSHFKTSGYYQVHQAPKQIPAELIGYCLARAFREAAAGEASVDVPLQDAARQAGSPGRVFALTSESLFEQVSGAEGSAGGEGIQIAGLAGNRVIRIRQQKPAQWLEAFYRRMARSGRDAA